MLNGIRSRFIGLLWSIVPLLIDCSLRSFLRIIFFLFIIFFPFWDVCFVARSFGWIRLRFKEALRILCRFLTSEFGVGDGIVRILGRHCVVDIVCDSRKIVAGSVRESLFMGFWPAGFRWWRNDLWWL